MALTKTTVGVTNISDLSSTPNATEGLTAAQLQAKFDKTGAGLKTYINDTLTVELDTSIGAINTIIGSDGSGHTIIGTNNVRATRFVSLDTPVVKVNNVDPANTDWVDVDVTANTSANAYAVTGTIFVKGATAGRAVFVRKNGTSVTGNVTQTATIQVASVYAISMYQVGLDTDQIFEYAASNADIDSIIITISGYWEYLD